MVKEIMKKAGVKMAAFVATLAVAVAVAGAALPSLSVQAAVTADPNGTMTGQDVTFAVDNGDADPSVEEYEEYAGRTFTTEVDLRGTTSNGTFLTEASSALTSLLNSGYSNAYGYTVSPSSGKWDNYEEVTAGVGQHVYNYTKDEGIIRVKQWILRHVYSQCIHHAYPTQNYWHGIDVTDKKATCRTYYNSIAMGWYAVCADCGEEIELLFYMTETTALGIDTMDASYYYYYLCPYNLNLEQGVSLAHTCKAISYNKYYVVYVKNGSNVAGSMTASLHMYNNATEYNGDPISAQTALSKNQYSRTGYTFLGWNTAADGSGTWYTDGQDILNLTDVNGGIVTLYAQWEVCNNVLEIDANGGKYDGSSVKDYTVDYQGSQDVYTSLVTVPTGYKVTFDTDGGSISGMSDTGLTSVSGKTGYTIKTVKDVSEWTTNFTSTNSYMEYSDSDGTFYNMVADTYKHILTVQYDNETFSLPSATKSGSVFVGWVLQTGTTGDTSQHAAGETVTPSDSMATSNTITYKAVYAEMSAQVIENYEDNSGKGAADLTWGWNKSLSNTVYYKIYRDGTLISTEYSGALSSLGTVVSVSNGSTKTYTCVVTGLYTFTCKGEAGASYGSYSGGKGATLEGSIWLNQGDKIYVATEGYAGGSSSYSGAGSGGAATYVTVTRKSTNTTTTVLIAGGGGAATPTKAGGSSTTVETTLKTSNTGASGSFGGGAGNTPGTAGTLTYHYHSGNSTSGGACYTHKTGTTTCGGGLYAEIVGYVYYNDGTNCGACGVGNQCVGHWQFWLVMGCENCGIIQTYDATTMSGATRYSVSQSIYNKYASSTTKKFWLSTGLKDTPSGYASVSDIGTYIYTAWGITANSTCSNKTSYDYYELSCGYTDGQVVDNTASTGGSSYYNPNFVSLSKNSGSNTGNGSFTLTASSVAFDSDTSLTGTYAQDLASPDTPTAVLDRVVVSDDKTSGTAYVTISKPDDNGTTYDFDIGFYMVSGTAGTTVSAETKVNTVPETVTLTTGVKGYVVGLFSSKLTNPTYNGSKFTSNGSAATALSTQNKTLTVLSAAKGSKAAVTSDADVEVSLEAGTSTRYAYVVAYDFAGNYSSVVEIVIPAVASGGDSWPITTNQLSVVETISGTGNVYQATNSDATSWRGSSIPTYYVRADGTASFSIVGSAYNDASADDSTFLIDSLAYRIFNTDTVKYSAISSSTTLQQAYTISTPDTAYKSDYVDTSASMTSYKSSLLNSGSETGYYRENDSSIKTTNTTMSFTVDSDQNGEMLYVYPYAQAATGTDLARTSTVSADKANGIILIPDGEGPEIDETGILELLQKYVDGKDPDSEFPYTLTITLTDELSGIPLDDDGLGEITVTITNKDNGSTYTYTPDDPANPYTVTIEIDKDDPLFSGDIKITVTSVDNVGNTTTKTYSTDAVYMSLDLVYTDAMVDGTQMHNYFLTMDDGELVIDLYGYADSIEIEVVGDAEDKLYFSSMTRTASGESTAKTVSISGEPDSLYLSFENDSSADITEEHSYLDWQGSFAFTVDGIPDDEESTITFKVTVTKGTSSITNTISAKWLKDIVTPSFDSLVGTETNNGISNVYSPTSVTYTAYTGQTLDNTYYVKAGVNFVLTYDYVSTRLARTKAYMDEVTITMENMATAEEIPLNESLYDWYSFSTLDFDSTFGSLYKYLAYNAASELPDLFDDGWLFKGLRGSTEGLILMGYFSLKDGNAGCVSDISTYWQNGTIATTARLLSSYAGKTIKVWTSVNMGYYGTSLSISSTDAANEATAVYLIPDAEGPETSGDSGLDQKVLTPGTPEDVTLTFTDDLSGYNSATITITNQTTGETSTYTTTDSSFTIHMDPDADLWIGATEITITTYDNVGNETTTTYVVYSFKVDATITTTFKPYTNVFYSGNRGYLWIETWGYVESLDITFPDDITVVNYVYQDGDNLGTLETTVHEASGHTVHIQLDDDPNHYSAHRIDLVEFVIDDSNDLDYEYTVEVIANKVGHTQSSYPNLYIYGYTGDLSRTRLR